ncbi:hypothetical protein MPLDJ20_130002 [Mesorhizobium plurifarium]|uniref:Cytochrome-c peroxidase n=1 Tax=Mesorhizobium plurifarium TaxID=69974 RepID=A0A090EI67_MESPL|nr:hypothetical protein MPLDJ20_130002 [Mesorhizobium plurifarium]
MLWPFCAADRPKSEPPDGYGSGGAHAMTRLPPGSTAQCNTHRPVFSFGKVWDLKQAVAIMGQTQLGEELTTEEVDRLVAFLNALTGRVPNVIYPILPVETATAPRPVSRISGK